MESTNELWAELNKLRDRVPVTDISSVVEELTGRGVDIGHEEIYALTDRLSGGAGFFALPRYAYNFICEYCKRTEASRLLDPYVNAGALLSAVADGLPSEIEIIGLVGGGVGGGIAERVLDGLPVQLRARNDTGESVGQFDLIMSVPPFGTGEDWEEIEVDGRSIRVRGSDGIRTVIKSARFLADGGMLVFLAPPKFFTARTSAWHKMEDLGIHPQGVIAFPPGALSGTGIPSSLVIAGREPVDQLFAAQLTNGQQIGPIIDNLLDRREGKKKELGRLVDKSDFVSWKALELDDEIQQLSARSGMEPVRLGDVVQEINTIRQGERFQKLELRENVDEANNGDGDGIDAEQAPRADSETVYLPRFGVTRDVVTQVEDIGGEHSHYIELIADSQSTSSEFLARVFNSELGQKLRLRWAGGRERGAVSSSDLEDRQIYLPPLETQEKVLRTHREIGDLQTELDELRSKLWLRPVDVEKVERDVERINQDEGLEDWIESLPFPLASVLWRYHASEELEHKQGFLIDFFEALAEFLSTVMLSAFYTDASLFQEQKAYWLGADEGYRESLKRSTFGNWYEVATRLAKDTRRMLSEEREQCLELYRATSPRWVQKLADKRIYRALKRVGTYRNDWRGHSGTTISRPILQKRIRQLKDQLASVRSAFGYSFERVHLLKPDRMEFRDGVYYVRVKRLTGSRTFFEETTEETTVPMDTNRLHLLERNASRSLKLLPFFQLMASPRSAQNACYFYNRVEGDGKVRWVSYHYEGADDADKSPIMESPEVVATLDEIMKEDGTSS